MAAVLTNSGIQFSDNTSLNSKYGIIPLGLRCCFVKVQPQVVGLNKLVVPITIRKL